MTKWWMRRCHSREAVTPTVHNGDEAGDDMTWFSPAMTEWLVARGMIFLTETVAGERGFGAIIATDFREACQLAGHRHMRVLGLMGPGFLKDWDGLRSDGCARHD